MHSSDVYLFTNSRSLFRSCNPFTGIKLHHNFVTRLQVTIVAVLQRLGANEDLYALVFGESCLNDAVGIVLYRTLTIFLHRRVSTGSVFAGIGSFLGVFLGSMAIGELQHPHSVIEHHVFVFVASLLIQALRSVPLLRFSLKMRIGQDNNMHSGLFILKISNNVYVQNAAPIDDTICKN